MWITHFLRYTCVTLPSRPCSRGTSGKQQQQQQQEKAQEHAASGISRLLDGEAQANKACKEFVQVRTRPCRCAEEWQKQSVCLRRCGMTLRGVVCACALLQMKAALGKDSRRLKAELDAAKELLRSRMQRAA